MVKTSAVQCKRYTEPHDVSVMLVAVSTVVSELSLRWESLCSPPAAATVQHRSIMFSLSTLRHPSKTCFFSIHPLFEKLNIMLNLKGTVLYMYFLCTAIRMVFSPIENDLCTPWWVIIEFWWAMPKKLPVLLSKSASQHIIWWWIIDLFSSYLTV